MAARIPYPAPEGYRWVPAASERWRPVSGKHCRRMIAGRKVCGEPAVLELNRRRFTQSDLVDAWWAYCLDHAYGNWLEDGEVWHWVLRENEPTS